MFTWCKTLGVYGSQNEWSSFKYRCLTFMFNCAPDNNKIPQIISTFSTVNKRMREIGFDSHSVNCESNEHMLVQCGHQPLKERVIDQHCTNNSRVYVVCHKNKDNDQLFPIYKTKVNILCRPIIMKSCTVVENINHIIWTEPFFWYSERFVFVQTMW